MPDSFESIIGRMTPENLRLFKQQLPLRIKEMGPSERNLAISRLRNVPEFADLFGGEPAMGRPMPEAPKTDVALWEKPAEWAETGMEALGRGMAKVPVLPEILEWAAPAFEFIHEKLERPFAAAITAPFSPAVAVKPGESWLEREVREYEEWEAPTYVKGVAEFAMPLWWIPWLGWAGKGAKALGVAGKAARITKVLPIRGGQAILPSYETMTKSIPNDIAKKMALWGEHVPVMKNLVQAVGGTAAFTRRNPLTLADKAKNYAVFKAVHLDMGNQIVTVKMPSLYVKLGKKTEKDLLQLYEGTKVGVVKTTATKPGIKVGEKVSYELDDVITHPELYEWTDKAAYEYIKTSHEIADWFEAFAKANGVTVPKRLSFRGEDFQYLPRIVEGVERGKGFEAVKRSVDPFLRIVYDTALEGAEAGVKYGGSVANRVELWGRAVARRVSNNKFDTTIKELGETLLQRLERFEPELAERISYHTNRVNALKKVTTALRVAMPLKGVARPIHGRVIPTIFEEFPELATKIGEVMSIKSVTAIDYIGKMSASAQKLAGIDAKPLVEALKGLPERASLDRALEVVTRFAKDEQKAIRLIERIFKADAKAELTLHKQAIKGLRDDVDQLMKLEKEALTPYKKQATKLRDYYTRPRLGEFEATFRQHPAFGGRIFPAEVVDVLKPILTDAGSKWGKNLAQISGASRMLVAALDLSAPFIQGLLVFGRNPVAWTKAVGKMFLIAQEPRKLYIELAKREATRMDRILHGGSSAMIDYFEAMPVLRKVARAIGKEPGEKLVAQTYGRAEAAFLGFGELARDELWRAGSFAIRKKGLSEVAQNTQLDDLARTLDRMTGVMSTERLGVGLSQRQIESAWIFFAPRYTRAGFSIMGDMLLKGGITGAEARTAMAGFMGGGLTMYMGACHALGQQPNFDPRSARFMTVEIGGRHIGVGGFQYSMMRFLANVAATAVEDPGMLSPLNLSRFDNPFYKFMYSKSAPLTGTLVGLAVEHKNYLGEPFESPADYLAFLADKVTPIAMQPMMPWSKEEGARTPTTFVAEIGGLRTFPESDWERRNDLRDKLAQDKYGVTWDEVGTLRGEAYQLEIERDSADLQNLTQIANETSGRLARGEGKIWSEWRNDMADIQEHRQESIETAARHFEATGDGVRFRLEVKAIERVRREMYGALKRNSEYNEVYEYFAEPLDKDVLAKMNPKDVARREYYKVMYSDDMYDEFGDYNFDEADRRETTFVRRYGEEALDYIEKYSGSRWEEPQALRLLKIAKKLLEPYWEIEDQVWANYPPELRELAKEIDILEKTNQRQAKILLMRNPSILMARKLIAQQRKMLKWQNPDIKVALGLFYTR